MSCVLKLRKFSGQMTGFTMQSTSSLAIQVPSQQAPTFKQMGAEPGHEKLCPHQQHVPLLGTLQARVLQGLQRQTVSEGGCSTHPLDQWQWFVKGRVSHYHFFFLYPWLLFLQFAFCHIEENNERLDVLQIELRKRVVLPKETPVANRMGAQPEPDRAREAVNIRREKRGGMRVRVFCFCFSHRCHDCHDVAMTFPIIIIIIQSSFCYFIPGWTRRPWRKTAVWQVRQCAAEF